MIVSTIPLKRAVVLVALAGTPALAQNPPAVLPV